MDRTTRGFLAGVIAGIAQNAWNLSDYYLFHYTKIRLLDWFAVLIKWVKPEGILETVVFQILQIIVWDGFMGIVFAHLVVSITSQRIVFKAVLYSLLLWFLFKVVVNFYHVPVLSGLQQFPGFLSSLLAVILWGSILGFVLKKLERRHSEP